MARPAWPLKLAPGTAVVPIAALLGGSLDAGHYHERYHALQATVRLHPVAAQRAYAADAADDRRDRRDELVRTCADLEAELRVINVIKDR
jgi:hypothetical protein